MTEKFKQNNLLKELPVLVPNKFKFYAVSYSTYKMYFFIILRCMSVFGETLKNALFSPNDCQIYDYIVLEYYNIIIFMSIHNLGKGLKG